MSVVSTEVEDRVATITLEHPPLNVVDLAASGELCAAIEGLARGAGLNAVLLRARGRVFSAGVDVRDHLPDRGARMIRRFNLACTMLLEIEVPVIAAVHGAALGGGWELAMSCDLVLASASATFALPEIKLGVFPPVAAIALPRLIGTHRAADLLLTGRSITAAEAERLGLVTRVAPEDGFDALVAETLATLRALSPDALRAAKRALRLSRAKPTREEIEASDALYMEERLNAPDAIEGLTAFMEKRPPRWKGAGE